jgi:serine protease
VNSANITGEVSNTLTGTVDLGEWSTDSYSHETHVVGTISALNNNIGTEGVNPNGLINLYIVKIIHKANYWSYWGSDVVDAVNRCVAAGSTVINMSLAGKDSSVAEQQAIDNAYNAGALLVSASGNRGNNWYYYPASYDSVISVGAVDDQSAAWSYTQHNDKIELVAPGVEVRSTLPGNMYGNWDGTSMATPYVSGVAALVWSHHPECSNRKIRNVLQLSALDIGDVGRDDIYGHGLVQLTYRKC